MLSHIDRRLSCCVYIATTGVTVSNIVNSINISIKISNGIRIIVHANVLFANICHIISRCLHQVVGFK